MDQAVFLRMGRVESPEREGDEAISLPAIQSEPLPSRCAISSTERGLVLQASVKLFPLNSRTQAHRAPVECPCKVDAKLVFNLVPQHLRLIRGLVLALDLRLERVFHP